jgi:intracellular septation protein
MHAAKTAPPWLRPVVDYGPLAAFFVGYMARDLMTATVALMAATAAALLLSLAVVRQVPKLPLITAALVGVFGGLTLWLDDPAFIKMKPTIVQSLFAVLLLGGLLFGRPLLRPVLGMAMPWPLSDLGWRLLSLRWGLFFAAMAILNEVVWRTQSTDLWVNFKVFGILALTILFALVQAPLLHRHRDDDEEAEQASG